MTLGQFAYLVGAPAKWVQNALQILGRPGSYDIETARVLRLSRIVVETVGIGLKGAWELAGSVMAQPLARSAWTFSSPDGSVSVGIDRQRYFSSFACALSASREWHRERPRGRPSLRSLNQRLLDQGTDVAALITGRRMSPDERLDRVDEAFRLLAPGSREDPSFGELLDRLRGRRVEFIVIGPMAAALHGSLRIPTTLDLWPVPEPRNLDRLVQLLRGLGAELRSVGPGIPFFLDRVTVQTQPVIPLSTRNGDLTLHTEVPGLETPEEIRRQSVAIQLGGGPLDILDVEPLHRSLLIRDGKEEREIAYELETLMELRLED